MRRRTEEIKFKVPREKDEVEVEDEDEDVDENNGVKE